MNTSTQTTDLKTTRMVPAQRVIQICLILFGLIATSGGILQMSLGEPETTQRLDNIHRFLGGIYLGCGLICWWAAFTVRKQNVLVFLAAACAVFGGTGRLISMKIVGLPEPGGVWLAYVLVEFIVPIIMITAQMSLNRKQGQTTT